MQEINFKVTTDEANLILEGLGHIPFARVYHLVAKLQMQAQQQINPDNPTDRQTENNLEAQAVET